MAKLILAILAVGIGAAVYMTRCCNPPTPPHLDTNEWWGPDGMKGRTDNSVRPFKIKFGEEMIRDLKDRLKRHRTFQPPLKDVGFRYGFNSEQLDSWISYWADKYNFSEREKWLNQYPQFKTNIQGLDIHFIRVKPQVPSNIAVVPLILVHGWPGSVREFYEAIPLLTTQRPGYDFVFEVVVPSLPGYGFSDPAVRPGLGVSQVSVIMRNLMNRLGFKKYYVQGGDWGSAVVSGMSVLFPDEVLGHHTNMGSVMTTCSYIWSVIGSFWPSLVVEPHLADRMYPLSKHLAFTMEESGYFHLQTTKPDTVGVALTDSPSGLLAYILEKFSTWTVTDHRDLPDGGLTTSRKFTKDQLIDNLMIYWSTNSITTSMRLYAESFSNKHRELNIDAVPTTVPTWVLQAKYELFYSPPKFLKTKYVNLLNVTVLEDGGHFIAFEQPQVLTADVFKAVKAFREWHAVNDKKNTEL